MIAFEYLVINILTVRLLVLREIITLEFRQVSVRGYRGGYYKSAGLGIRD